MLLHLSLFKIEGISKFQSSLKRSDSFSSLVPDKEYIKSLDLSSNELENIDNLCHCSFLMSHLEHLEKLELHQNALSHIPEQLCEVSGHDDCAGSFILLH